MKILGDLEQKIMNVVWNHQGSVSVREVMNELKDDCAYTTVMTVMKRLSDKGLLVRKLDRKTYVYSPAKEKGEFAKNKLSDLFKNLMNSYGELAISQFVDSVKNNPEDLETLKDYLQDE